ncbi:chaplin [Streptomyces thermoalcalitolerans]|uniref:Chaplin ChpG n=1 Tax=Streptomyces thermoalcalitolerans TaxID=65605 RepID=A0ABP3ZIB4_9ACTN
MSRITKGLLLTSVAASAIVAGSGVASAESEATGGALNSSGLLSGNVVQVPAHVPVNACGNTVHVVGALSPATNNTCAID